MPLWPEGRAKMLGRRIIIGTIWNFDVGLQPIVMTQSTAFISDVRIW
jgi:hypothetical protein